MAKTNQNSIFYFRGKIDFENLLVLEKKQLENLPLEQNIFVLKKLSVNLGGDDNNWEGLEIFNILINVVGANILKLNGKISKIR